MKLEANMYVRTKDFGVTKIHSINETKTKWKYTFKTKKQDGDGCIDLGVLCEYDIIKASYSIIDLIEVGDYVNGYKVECVNRYDDFSTFTTKLNNGYVCEMCDDSIKSIVTREQFENMKYEAD